MGFFKVGPITIRTVDRSTGSLLFSKAQVLVSSFPFIFFKQMDKEKTSIITEFDTISRSKLGTKLLDY